MRHVFALVGSRGDVQPALAVALELRRRGHEVVTGVAPNLVPLAVRLGLDPVPLGIDSAALLGSDLVRRDMRSAHPVRRVRALRAVA
ncbi:glycosyltransferase, partial [Promicromonospora kroppenstedtii]|uniref:glycosyltransferase n=1 Tax=Promicromonospora kroppenstedtii TaxID=440482 RepID=UPI001B7F96FF